MLFEGEPNEAPSRSGKGANDVHTFQLSESMVPLQDNARRTECIFGNRSLLLSMEFASRHVRVAIEVDRG